MKRFFFAASLAVAASSFVSNQAYGFDPFKAIRKAVEAPVKVAGKIAEEGTRRTAKGLEGFAKGVVGTRRSEFGPAAGAPVWHVYFYPQGAYGPAQFVGAYVDYTAALNHRQILASQGYNTYLALAR